jgi:phosphoglycerate dehydrogenase-like enzyme
VRVLLGYRERGDDVARVRAVSGAVIVEAAETPEEAVAKVAEAEAYLAGHWSDELWRSAPRLRWVQSWGAGVEWLLTPDFVASPIMLTNAQGVYAIPIAEHVIALMLCFARGLNHLVRNQAERQWRHTRVAELEGSTLGIVGLGGIGTEVAKRGKCLGMRVVATRRRPERPSEFADEVRGPDHLPWLLRESDYVVLCAALTPGTRHLIGAPELAVMKSSAYLINIGRGGLVDEEALAAALAHGGLAGAGLDVFETEPLPRDSRLWDLPNVVVTPHLAGSSPRSHDRLVDLFCENLRRYLAGAELLNVVDKAAGY